MSRPPRIAVRAIILHQGRLLLVNAYAGRADLWCAPGGGVEAHASLHDNLIREVFEETGLTIAVGPPALVNEFHDVERDFHQVDIYFHASILRGTLNPDWTDPEGIVTDRRWVNKEEARDLRIKPDALIHAAWGDPGIMLYDPLEPIIR
ncbi:NUDIX domain-containing protein [Loktanella sp. R86503]|uniref:NUDIX domain-containing protein n=1 Tax=Loktanella sp. R86503 TaxID=3093847 RepID=UPI0036DEB460